MSNYKDENTNLMGSLTRFQRKKTMMQEEDDFMLLLTIHSADGIDPQTTDPKGDKRNYSVACCLNHIKEFWTPRTPGLPNPRWNWGFQIPLRESMDDDDGFGFLKLEVLRTGSTSDPGTSNGDVLVGRTLVQLSENINQKRRLALGL